jgi:2'-5' RNA ligase
MVAFFVPADVARELAIEGGEPVEELHITLAYTGKAADLTEQQVTDMHRVVAEWAAANPPLDAKTSGIGIFQNDDDVDGTDVTYASVDAPGLPSTREDLIARLLEAGVPVDQTHGYTPHITLLYRTTDELEVPTLSFPLSEVSVMVAGNRNDFALEGSPAAITAAGANAIVDALGRVWKPWLHPRDHNGRFINTFGQVKFRTKKGGEFNDASGRVERISPNGDIWVRMDKALSPDAKQKFGKGDLVRVPKGDIEVLDSKARLSGAGGKARALNGGQRRRLDNNIKALRNARSGGNPIPGALKAADLLEQARAESDVLERRLKNRRDPDATPEKRAESAAKIGELFEQAASELDTLRGEGHQDGDKFVPGQAGALETLYDNAFATSLSLQGQVLGETKGRLQKGALAQGRGQERSSLPGDTELPGAETGVNVYKDIDGNAIDDPIEAERETVNKARVNAGQPELTSEEFVRDFVAGDRLVKPRAVNGLDRLGALFRRGKGAPADRRTTDKDGTSIQPGSIVQVDAGSGRGGGAWVRPAFTGLVVRIHEEKNGAKTAVVRDFRPDLFNTPEADRDPNVPKGYYEKGYHDYTRTSSASVLNVTPEDGNNFGILMANLQGEFGISYDELSKAMVEIGAERHYAGMNAGRLSELSRNGAIAITLRRKIDGNGRVIQQGDWVWTGAAYAQVVYMEPNTNTIGVQVGGEGKMQRLSARKVAFAHGASGAVFGRNDLDAISAAGMYAPTREEAAAVARRRGLDTIADAIEGGATGSALKDAFENDPAWGAFAAEAINARGRFYDRAQRGLGVGSDETVKIQDSTILGAALSDIYRDGADVPQQNIDIPETEPQIDVPDAPQIPEGIEVPEGAKAILNPDSENSVLVRDADGNVNEWIKDPETGGWVDAGTPVPDEEPLGPIDNVNEAPEGFERRQNGRGRKDTFVSPDGRITVSENKRGQLVVTDQSDPEEPDVIGVAEDWNEALDFIEEHSPDSLPQGESTIEEIYETREESARARLSEVLGTDVTDKTPDEITDTDEFADASTGEAYPQIAFDLNEIAAANDLKEQGIIEEGSLPSEAPVDVVEPEAVEAPAAPETPEAPAEAGGLGQNIIDALWGVSERMKADQRIPDAVVDAVANEIFRMEDALESGDTDAFESAVGQIIRNPGVPEPIRRGLGGQLQDFKRNGGLQEVNTPGAAAETPAGAFDDQAGPIDYARIEVPGGVNHVADIPAFIESFMDNFGDWLNNRIETDKVGDRFWTTEKQRTRNADTIKALQEVHKQVKTALEDPELADEDREASIEAALTRLKNIAGVRGEGAGIYSGLIQSLIDRNRNGYDLRGTSENLAGQDIADALLDDPIYELAVSGEVEPGGYAVVDGEGEPVDTGYVAEYPESRLVVNGGLSQEDFNDYWDNVVVPLFNEDESAAFLFTTDEEGNTVLTVGTWTEDEATASEVAAGNGDAYYDGGSGNWVDPNATSAFPEEDPRIQDIIDQVQDNRQAARTPEESDEYQEVILALEDLAEALKTGDRDAINEAAGNLTEGPDGSILGDITDLQREYMRPEDWDPNANPDDTEPEAEPEGDEGPDGGGGGGGDTEGPSGGGGAAPGFSQEKTDAVATIRASGEPVYVVEETNDDFLLRELGDVTVTPSAVYAPNPVHKDAFEQGDISPATFVELNGTDTAVFHDAVGKGKDRKFGSSVTQYDSPADYEGYRMFLSEDGGSGFAVSPDGDIVSAFSNGQGLNSGAGDAILQLAIQQGGTRLDAFDTVLPSIYSRAGFKATGRTKFNDEFAPADWNYDEYKAFNDGRPDVVFMALDKANDTPYASGDGDYFDDYDEASANNKAVADELNGESNAPGNSTDAERGGDDGGVSPSGDGDSGGGGSVDDDGRGGSGGGPDVAVITPETLDEALGAELAARSAEITDIDLGDPVEPLLIAPKKIFAPGGINLDGNNRTTPTLEITERLNDIDPAEIRAVWDIFDEKTLSRVEEFSRTASAQFRRMVNSYKSDTYYEQNPQRSYHGTMEMIGTALTLDNLQQGRILSEEQRVALYDVYNKVATGSVETPTPLPDVVQTAVDKFRGEVTQLGWDSEPEAFTSITDFVRTHVDPTLLMMESLGDSDLSAAFALSYVADIGKQLVNYSTSYFGKKGDMTVAFQKAIDEFVETVGSTVDVRVKPFAPKAYEGDESIGLAETANGEVSLASVAGYLLNESGVDLSDPEAVRKFVGTNGINLQDGLSIDPIARQVGAGINGDYTFLVRAEGTGQQFVLKYDHPDQTYAEIAAPRLMRAAGTYTPTVQPLANMDGVRGDAGGKFPFLQTWAGVDDGLDTLGQADEIFAEHLSSWPSISPTGLEATDENKARATEALRLLWSNISALRSDAHGGNVILAKDGDTLAFVGIDNGFAAKGPVFDVAGAIRRGDYLNTHYGTWAMEFIDANPDLQGEYKKTLGQWAEGLRDWYAANKDVPLSQGGLKGASQRYVNYTNYLDVLTGLDNDAIWDTLRGVVSPYDYQEPETYNFFTLRETEVLS